MYNYRLVIIIVYYYYSIMSTKIRRPVKKIYNLLIYIGIVRAWFYRPSRTATVLIHLLLGLTRTQARIPREFHADLIRS